MSKFTPGPWSVGTSKVAVWGRGEVVADAWESNDRPNEECEANARLIAAAPEMYEALKGAQIMIGFLLEYAELHRSFTKASKRNANVTRIKIMDVLAKADGGQQ